MFSFNCLLITVFNSFLCSFAAVVDSSLIRWILLYYSPFWHNLGDGGRGSVGNHLEAVNLRRFQSTQCIESLDSPIRLLNTVEWF